MTTMEKKEYIRPTALIIELLEYSMICASVEICNDEINTIGRVQGENRDTWSNIW